MAYPALDPGKFGPGTPIDVSNLEALWRGSTKTNGFLMRSVDGRIPALEQPIGQMRIAAGHVLEVPDSLPWGVGLWRNIAEMDTAPGAVHASKPTKGFLAGLLKFNQGWQAGNPIIPWGVPRYSKAVMVSKGLVGFKTAMAAVGQEDEYLGYLKGDTAQDIATVRTTYKDWITAYKQASTTDGSKLGLFVGNDSGFPIVSVVLKANLAAPTLTGATFAGFAEVFEKEHEAIFFDINL
jgi:hypothetical protein